jgi:hypothetical protein
MNYKNRISAEQFLFYFLIVVNTIPVLSFKYFLTIDGPSHLYNAKLIREVLFGNSPLLSSLFQFNPVILPNWTGHLILAMLSSVFNCAMSEKIFILLFLVFLPVSFRYMIKAFSASQNILSYLIIPFTYTYLFEVGFFNYCIALIFMFLSIGYWIKNEGNLHVKQVLIFSFLFTLTFFSHILIFGILELLISLMIVGVCLRDSDTLKTFIANLLKKSGILLLASLPGLILMVNFFMKISIHVYDAKFPLHQLLSWVVNVKPLVLFNITLESKITHYFGLIYCVIFLFSIILRISQIRKNPKDKINHYAFKQAFFVTDLILLFSLFILLLFFIIPDGMSAGMMSERLCLLFFIFLITWLAIQTFPKWFNILVLIATLGVYTWLMIEHYPGFKDLANYASEINKAGNNIRQESVVLRIDWSDHWMLGHTPDYMGVDNSVVFTSNFEAELKWFPIIYKEENLPRYLLGDKETLPNLWWKNNHESKHVKKIDYIFIFGYTGRLSEPNNKELKKVMDTYYSLVYASSNHVYLLYASKPTKELNLSMIN